MTITKLSAILVIAIARARGEEPSQQTMQRIVISIPDRKLAFFDDGKLVKVYDVAVGKPKTPSPTGLHRVIVRVENPTWYGPSKTVPAGKTNPVGTRWIGLSAKGYGIHGTNAPRSIGKAASHGCIRMRNRDVEELFSLVQIGAEVDLRTETPDWIAAPAASIAADED
jgi:lipoprotein-anchoring transpeptidase ErfK/SrfK